MKLQQIEINNFRQFYGEHVIEFSIDQKQNVTVIHGENGGGKTTLLNAFKWCFFGTTDFDTGNDNILNEHLIASAKTGEKLSLSISVNFEHEGRIYKAKRTQSYKKTENVNADEAGGAPLELNWIDETGASKSSENPQNHINQILPEKMHSYFFFNGERIEKLSYASASHEIRDAIRTLMGLEIVERGKKHLQKGVRKHFANETKKGASDELSQAINTEESLIESIAETKERIRTSNDNQEKLDEAIKTLEARLRENEKAAGLQKQKEECIQNRDIVINQLKEIGARQRALLSKSGFLSFIGPIAREVKVILDERRKKGELPYKIKGQFIDDLLKSGVCICGTHVKPGTTGYISIEKYGTQAQSEGVEDAFIDTSGALGLVGSARKDMFDSLKSYLLERKGFQEQREKLTERLDEIETQLGDSEDINVASIQKKINEYEGQKTKATLDLGAFLASLESLQADLNKAVEHRKELSKKSDQAEVAKRQLDLVDECARVIEELHEALSLRTKDNLSNQVNETLQKILKKNYWAEIDDSYQLNVFKTASNGEKQPVYEKSTGESQVTSLSFIGGIIALAREQQKKENKFFKGGVFPLVMDSPFGSLDPTYSELIARHIPELAEQIILLVSRKQWRGEVQSECAARAGKHVSLIYYAPEVAPDKISDYVRTGAEYEHTIVEEGYHG